MPLTDVAAAQEAAAAARARIEATVERAATFTEEQRQQRVDGEWSTVESLRHLVLVIDLWLSRAILGEQDPFHPIALPPTFMPTTLFPGTSIDPDSRPSFDEACEVVRTRLATLDGYVAALNPAELARTIEAHAGTVGGALSVIVTELTAHDGFVNRDLDRIAATPT